ncbi:hypothetical protein MUO65_04065 [bacterium]|nr:hypothetical protein [bacterium]
MNNLTLLYYTANVIPEATAEKVRNHLLTVTENNYPIVSVSQKPINFGQSIHVGVIGQSNYNCYKQILTGAKEVKTKYLACCEDDTLYNAEHFTHRPSSDDTFTYNSHTWFSENKIFWKQEDMSGMAFYIAPTELLIKILTPRFEKYPTPPRDLHHWAEPGKFESELFGIPNPKVETFRTKDPVVTFGYRGSLSGKRKRYGLPNPDYYTEHLEPFVEARDTWRRFWDE